MKPWLGAVAVAAYICPSHLLWTTPCGTSHPRWHLTIHYRLQEVANSGCMQAVELKLAGLGVRRLVVQSVRALLPMWMGSLDFLPLTLAEADRLDPLLISPDPDSAQLIKKELLPGCAQLPGLR